MMINMRPRESRKVDVQHLALLGMFLAVALVLTAVESFLPPLQFMPPGVKIGLSNVITMYCLFCFDQKSVFALAVLKSVFVFLISGFTAFLLSLGGGLLSICVMIFVSFAFRNVSYLLLSIAGAIAHNIGQIIIASFLMSSMLVLAYLPVLLISGVIMGGVTGALLRLVMPAMTKLHLRLSKASITLSKKN